ncbi:EsaB/YukD family protein [Paenibacillus sp. FSL E2-0201]|uniref:EsaB/YukD family protein n=2 Tax=Paenibacillus TaxID=44249 RepID=UPI0030DD5AA5
MKGTIGMDYIMVTLQTGIAQRIDLKVPVFVTIEELLVMLASSLHVKMNGDVRLQAEPLGRILNNSKTLDQEGVAHGALLTLI